MKTKKIMFPVIWLFNFHPYAVHDVASSLLRVKFLYCNFLKGLGSLVSSYVVIFHSYRNSRNTLFYLFDFFITH